jgi:hypothetical protein
MDAFSEILSGVKLSGAVFFSAEFSAPWGLSAPAGKVVAEQVAPGAAHVVLYHLLIDGTAFIEMEDGQSVALVPGDVVIFPHGDSHHMSSGKAARPPFPNYGITPKIKARDLSPLRAGGGGAVSRFVCGYMTCDPHLSRPILDGLPPVFKVNVRADSAGHWLETSIMHLVDEAVSGRVGSEAMLAKLSEALFVDTCGVTSMACPNNRTAGWRARAIPSWAEVSRSCMAESPTPGGSPTSPTKWASRDRRSSSASVDISPNHRWPISPDGDCNWLRSRSRRHREALRTLPSTSDTSRKPPSAARSDGSLGSLQADTGAITSVRGNTHVRLDK